jgi:hypothetical protein
VAHVDDGGTGYNAHETESDARADWRDGIGYYRQHGSAGNHHLFTFTNVGDYGARLDEAGEIVAEMRGAGVTWVESVPTFEREGWAVSEPATRTPRP